MTREEQKILPLFFLNCICYIFLLSKDATHYLVMIKEELGEEWLNPEMFRFGASSLLGDIERQLEHHVSGQYSAGHRHSLA